MPQTARLGKANTKIVKLSEGGTRVEYYGSPIVMFDDRLVLLDDCGFRTQATKLRMNQASNHFGLGYYISNRGDDWFITYNGKTEIFSGKAELSRFGVDKNA